jgi:hypothetical protein
MRKKFKGIVISTMTAVMLMSVIPVSATQSTGNTGTSNTTSSTSTGNSSSSTSTESSTTTQAAQPVLSKDNSLTSLKLSSGELSPAFQSQTVKYTATVSYDVTSVEVDAVLSNNKATIDSITGNTDLQVGENTIKITVTSEAGTTAVYTIVVTRSEEGAAQTDEQGEEAAAGEEAATGEEGASESGEVTAVINADGTVTVEGNTYNVSQNYAEESQGQVYSQSAYDKLNDKYQSLKKKSKMGFCIFVVVILLLIFALVNTRMKRHLDGGFVEDLFAEDDDEEEQFGDFEENEPKKREPKKRESKRRKKQQALISEEEIEKNILKSKEEKIQKQEDTDWDSEEEDWELKETKTKVPKKKTEASSNPDVKIMDLNDL